MKKIKILHHLTQIGREITFLQEAHLSDIEEKVGQKSLFLFTSVREEKGSSNSSKQTGSLNFYSKDTHEDTKGRYILLNGLNDGIEISLIIVYALNEYKMFNVLIRDSVGILLMGGDFNCVMSQYADKQPISGHPLE